MRQLFRHIALFALPFLGILIWVLAAPYTKEYAYTAIQKDCRSGKWMYQRLFENEKPIDVAFMGTSKTMCGVNDFLLQERLEKEKGIQLEIANLGVCRTGENLHYLIVRDLIEQKRPQILFYEISAHIATNSHFHFPNVAETRDVLTATAWYNDDYFSDILKLTWARVRYQREQLLGIQRSYEEILDNPNHSFMVVENDIVAPTEDMEKAKAKRTERKTTTLPTGIPGLIFRASTNFPNQYLRRVAELCQANGTQLLFLYLPAYGVPGKEPRNRDFYLELAPILYPPDSIFRNPNLHFDPSHLNQKGAARFTDWLMEAISAHIAPTSS